MVGQKHPEINRDILAVAPHPDGVDEPGQLGGDGGDTYGLGEPVALPPVEQDGAGDPGQQVLRRGGGAVPGHVPSLRRVAEAGQSAGAACLAPVHSAESQ